MTCRKPGPDLNLPLYFDVLNNLPQNEQNDEVIRRGTARLVPPRSLLNTILPTWTAGRFILTRPAKSNTPDNVAYGRKVGHIRIRQFKWRIPGRGTPACFQKKHSRGQAIDPVGLRRTHHASQDLCNDTIGTLGYSVHRGMERGRYSQSRPWHACNLLLKVNVDRARRNRADENDNIGDQS